MNAAERAARINQIDRQLAALADHLTRLAQIAEMQMQATEELLRVMGVVVDPHPDAEPAQALSADDTRDWDYQDRREAAAAAYAAERAAATSADNSERTAKLIINGEEVEIDKLPVLTLEDAAEDNIDPFDAMRAELAEDDEPPPEPDEEDLWRRRLDMWHENRIWAPGWGPRPGQEGCRVPYEMLGGGR
jgi:hypothetical protein